jgi:hypothetical protein
MPDDVKPSESVQGYMDMIEARRGLGRSTPTKSRQNPKEQRRPTETKAEIDRKLQIDRDWKERDSPQARKRAARKRSRGKRRR